VSLLCFLAFVFVAVEGLSRPREDVIWTKLLEGLLLLIEWFRIICNTTCLVVEMDTFHLHFLIRCCPAFVISESFKVDNASSYGPALYFLEYLIQYWNLSRPKNGIMFVSIL
jgi:hypothetical protein